MSGFNYTTELRDLLFFLFRKKNAC